MINDLISEEKSRIVLRYLPLILIIAIGSFIRYYYTGIVVLRGDETSFIYQAQLISKGNIPFKDHFARANGYTLFLACWMKIFGGSLITIRLSSVFISILTSLTLYQIGSRIKDHRCGLLITAFFMFTPYNFRLGSIVMTEVLEVYLLTLSVLFLIVAMTDSRRSYLIMCGILVGYSFFIRRTAILFVVIIPLSILAYQFTNKTRSNLYRTLKQVIVDSGIFFISFLLFISAVYAFFISQTSLSFMHEVTFFGAGSIFDVHDIASNRAIVGGKSLVFYSFFSVIFFLAFISSYFSRYLGKNRVISYRSVLPFLFVLLFRYLSPFNIPPRTTVTGEFFDLVVISAFIAAALPGSIKRRLSSSLPEMNSYITASIFIFISFVVYQHLQYYSPLLIQLGIALLLGLALEIVTNIIIKGYRDMIDRDRFKSITSHPHVRSIGKKIYDHRILIFSVAILQIFLYSEESVFNNQEKTLLNIIYILSFFFMIFLMRFIKTDHYGLPEFIIVAWFFSFLIFYIYYGFDMEFYYFEFIVPVIIGAGIAFHRLTVDIPPNYRPILKSVLTLAVISLFISHSIYMNTFERQSETDLISPETHQKIVDYLEERTEPGEEIFTATFSIAVQAGLSLHPKITFKTYYNRPDIFPDPEITGFPSIEDLMIRFLSKPVRYCVIDPLTSLYFFSTHPDFEEFIKEHYDLEKTIVNVEIYRIMEDYQ